MDNENQRVKLTKRLLREALISLMETKQIQQISVRELCEKAEINRSTFYKHYGAPENILQEIQQELIANIIALAEDNGRPVPMRLYLERICEFLWNGRKLYRVLLSSQTGSEDMDLFRMTSSAMWNVKTFRQDVRPLDPLTDQAAILFVESGCYSVFRWWLLDEIDKTPKEIAELLCNLIGLKD